MELKNITKPMKKITGILDILICLLLFISALYKGGFYKEDSLFINMIICMLGLVCLSVKLVLNITDNRKLTKSKIGTVIDICVMLFPIAYFLPVLFGKYASKEAAIFESLRYVNFTIIYFIVRTTSNKKIYLTSIVAIGIVLAILGLDEITYRGIGKLLEPLSINYLQDSGGKISSTLQYANITALFMLISSIIVLNKLVNNLPKLKVNDTLKFKLLVSFELFILIILQSAILLTTSRMNVMLMILTSLIHCGYCLKQGKKKSAIIIIVTLFIAFVLVTSIDAYMLVQNNFMICLTYIITLVLILALVLISCKFKTEQIESKKKYKLNKKHIVVLIVLAVIVLVLLMLPNELRVSNSETQKSIVTRNIYTNLDDVINLDITFKFYKNKSFELHLYELDENFNKKIVVSITEDRLKGNKYTRDLKISKESESLMLTFETIDSDVSIEELKINGEEITLSYKFLPDTMVFRLIDTFTKDSNNNLRFKYYADAIKLFNKSKLVGIGGEGFKARYQEVQTEGYISSEVHSTPLQILVEAGLIGFVVFVTLCVFSIVITYRLCKSKNEEGLLYMLILVAFLLTSAFDLVLSYGIMIYMFAIMIGLIIGEYKRANIIDKDTYELDNKSTLGMLKIGTLSVSLMALFMISLYSVNIYRASIIIVPEDNEDLNSSYERVGALENKVKLDKYNLAYLNSLLAQYDKHIDLLQNIYILTQDESERYVIKVEIDNYIMRQKEIADSIIENEYYNKYALEKVARCYFKRYIVYADLYHYNFKNDEIAYIFYVGYGIKLTDRLSEIGPFNNLAKEFAIDIYEEYLPVIEKQNKILNSNMIKQAIEDMKNKLDSLKSVNI